MAPPAKIRVAFVKYVGLSAGGTERWMQMMAANLSRERFEVDYFYCDAAPYIGAHYPHAGTDPSRLQYMREAGVNLIEFRIGAKDVTKPTHDWVETDFWEKFDAKKYDIVQAAKAGPAEYPFHLMNLPVVECMTLMAGVDRSPNLAWSVHISQWQRLSWVRAGGRLSHSSIVPIPALPPATAANLRQRLSIPASALVAGFHQRADDNIFSDIPLTAFGRVASPDRYFVIMGGGGKYREQARRLKLDNIRFVEHSGDAVELSSFLNTLDVFAHGRSDGETFGTVFAEAMTHGRPCLSHTSVKGYNGHIETVGPGGYVVDGVETYTRRLDEMLSSAALRQRLSAKGQSHAREHYALPSAVAALASVYERVLGGSATVTGRSPLPYAYSPLGCLYAGEIDQPDQIAHHLVHGQVPEAFDVHIANYFLRQAQVMIDVGSNTGVYCVSAAVHAPQGAKIVAFDPQIDCCDALSQTVWLNNWEDRLIVRNLGLSDCAGELTLHISGSGSTFENAFNDNADLPTRRVPVDTLDHQVQELGLSKVDFIKIDVEGLELRVLRGAAGVIERDKPTLFIEIADRVRGRNFRNPNFKATFQWLAERGYQCLRCDEDWKLRRADANEESERPARYLCVHQLTAATEASLHAHARDAVNIRRRRRMEQFSQKFSYAVRHPVVAAIRVGQIAAAIGKDRISAVKAKFQRSELSKDLHHAQYADKQALERHRKLYVEYESTNLFNHPENRIQDLMSKHPQVRSLAVDIGCGGGWVSAHLSRDFASVVGIEPSAAALEIAKSLYPAGQYQNITWINAYAEPGLMATPMPAPTLLVTCCVLSHLPDNVVEGICRAVNTVPPSGSILSFAEVFGPARAREMWHVRPESWWRERLSNWDLDFHGPEAPTSGKGHRKGIHGVRR